MASLVADYVGSSDSEEDSELKHDNLSKEETKSSVGVNLLEAANDDSPCSGDELKNEEETDQSSALKQETGKRYKLPNPLTDSVHSKLPSPSQAFNETGSVFVTSFQKAEEAKNSILEQHVKMTASKLPADTGGKKICWNFRKGKCRFGSKCKYSHGNEIVTHKTEANDQNNENLSGGTQQVWQGSALEEQQADDEGFMSNLKRKKRPGVADTLIPPKKAMQQLDKIRQQERPWTYNK